MKIRDIVENHKLRSNYIRDVVQGKCTYANSNNQGDIPKVIVQYWHKPNSIPIDVQKCLDSWKKLETKGFKIKLFNDDSARRFIQENLGIDYLNAFSQCKHPAMRCDYFRLCYIYKNGGIYVDADDQYNGNEIESLLFDHSLKLQPLCYDANSKSMIPFNAYVTNRNFSEDWIFYINNNPIIAPPKHTLIGKALNQATHNIFNSIFSFNDIQSITGPGNLTSSFVELSLKNKLQNQRDSLISFFDWGNFAQCQWNLDYRKDNRNWRRWKAKTSCSQTNAKTL